MYQYKRYDKSYTLQEIIPIETINSVISFSSQKNGGQGRLSINITQDWADGQYDYYDIIEVYYISEFHPSGYLIYTGQIREIDRFANMYEGFTLMCYGYASDLTELLYQDGGTNFTKNDTANNILDNIINYYNTERAIDLTRDIDVRAGNINIGFSSDDILGSIKKVTNFSSNYYYYIDQNLQFSFKEITGIQYTFIYGENVQSLTLPGVAEIKNKLYLDYDGGSKTYTESASIALYGVREIFVSESNIKNEASADEFAEKYFFDNAFGNNEIKLEINRKYVNEIASDIIRDDVDIRVDLDVWEDTSLQIIGSIETIRPGGYCKLLNVNESIEGVIEKLDYKDNIVILHLNKYNNFIDLIRG